MLISEVLRKKGSEVATVAPETTIEAVVESRAQFGVGALVVLIDGSSVDGIISERDIVRALATDGASTLAKTAADLMTAEVVSCAEDATIEQLMAEMTERRIRHVPVTTDGQLVGIGDVVNARVHNLEIATESLTNYISGY
ncbi:MAG: CBS domain-containing protein [Acidimicrobiales bacterium]|jgi:CBS domain-containing protein|nr:CBS domain-containing protein [Acidimicrobiales bacterium]